MIDFNKHKYVIIGCILALLIISISCYFIYKWVTNKSKETYNRLSDITTSTKQQINNQSPTTQSPTTQPSTTTQPPTTQSPTTQSSTTTQQLSETQIQSSIQPTPPQPTQQEMILKHIKEGEEAMINMSSGLDKAYDDLLIKNENKDYEKCNQIIQFIQTIVPQINTVSSNLVQITQSLGPDFINLSHLAQQKSKNANEKLEKTKQILKQYETTPSSNTIRTHINNTSNTPTLEFTHDAKSLQNLGIPKLKK